MGVIPSKNARVLIDGVDVRDMPDFSKLGEFETRHPDDILDEVVITRADYNSPATLEYRRKTRVVFDSAAWTGRYS
jgi:hypothetical protein